MDIKVGDIVEYCGKQYRVLNYSKGFKVKLHLFSDFGSTWAYESDVNLVESVDVPTLKVGDTVIIHDIPSYEKTASNGVWVGRMRYRIGKTFKVEKYMNHCDHGPLVLLDDLWFRTYHLEKIDDYDII